MKVVYDRTGIRLLKLTVFLTSPVLICYPMKQEEIKMETKNVNVSLSKNKKLESLIMIFFTKSGGLFECQNCSKLLRGYNFILKQHLKTKHKDLWSAYLSKIRTVMTKKVNERSKSNVGTAFLKCHVLVKTEDGSDVSLSLPESRQTRECVPQEDLELLEHLAGFKGRIQGEYNTDPIGPYMGPFDQSESLPLRIQLPLSRLNYRNYTEYRHDESTVCGSYKIKESYNSIGDLEKIESLEIDVGKSSDKSSNKKGKIMYTCRKGNCQIPCICKECCESESQCKLHKIKHEELFNYEQDSMTIRSSEIIFKDSSFLSNAYTIRYPNISISCHPCARDLQHHNLYHIKYHESCKFCLQIRHKLKAKTVKKLREDIKWHTQYLELICPHCDKIFREKSNMKRHMDSAHGNVVFNCNFCEEKFASKQALDYHEQGTHMETSSVKCDECDVSFASIISMKDHKKHVHSVIQKIGCTFCGSQFKRKKDLNFHLRNKHEINTNDFFMNEWNDHEPREKFQCDLCALNNKYKKDLQSHKKKSHDIEQAEERFSCDQCGSSYKNNKGLNEHKRNKHEESVYNCNICGKLFNQKNNCMKHERNHKDVKNN